MSTNILTVITFLHFVLSKKREIMTIQMLIIVIMIFICFVHFSHKSINLFLHSQELSLKTKDVMEIHKDKR